jgi:hypothetical protein
MQPAIDWMHGKFLNTQNVRKADGLDFEVRLYQLCKQQFLLAVHDVNSRGLDASLSTIQNSANRRDGLGRLCAVKCDFCTLEKPQNQSLLRVVRVNDQVSRNVVLALVTKS